MRQWAGAEVWKKSACSLNTLAATSPTRWSCLCLWKEMKQNHIRADSAAGCSPLDLAVHTAASAHCPRGNGARLNWRNWTVVPAALLITCTVLSNDEPDERHSAVSAYIPNLPGPEVSTTSKRCQWRNDRQPVKRCEKCPELADQWCVGEGSQQILGALLIIEKL